MPYYSQPQYQAPIIQQPVPQYRTSAPLVAPMLPAAQQPAPAAFNLADFRLRPPEVRLATAKPVRKEDDDEEESRGRTRRKKHKQPVSSQYDQLASVLIGDCTATSTLA